jgi:hypothetical protein
MLHGVFVGVGARRDGRVPSMPAAHTDAEAMYACVAAAAADPRQLTFLLGERATKATIERVLTKELPARVTEEDTVLLYLAGSGCLGAPSTHPEPSTQFFTYDSTIDGPRASSLDITTELSTWMRALGAKLVALVVDATFADRPSGGPGAGRSTPPPSSLAKQRPRWSTMAMGTRCVVLSSHGDTTAASSGEATRPAAFTQSLIHAIAAAPGGTLITPALLHAATMPAKSPVLLGASFTTRTPLFRTR